jgi:hypothetical protein
MRTLHFFRFAQPRQLLVSYEFRLSYLIPASKLVAAAGLTGPFVTVANISKALAMPDEYSIGSVRELRPSDADACLCPARVNSVSFDYPVNQVQRMAFIRGSSAAKAT